MDPVRALHLVSTVAMSGLIVFVQAVHYPLMARVGREGFARYQEAHMARTGVVVIPLMTTELATASWIFLSVSTPAETGWATAGLILLALIWLSTATLQAPVHGALATRGFHAGLHRRLLWTNWIRTGAWVCRVPVALALTG